MSWFADKMPSAAALRQKADKFNSDVEARFVDAVLQAADVAASAGKYEVTIDVDGYLKDKSEATAEMSSKLISTVVARLEAKAFQTKTAASSLTVMWSAPAQQ